MGMAKDNTQEFRSCVREVRRRQGLQTPQDEILVPPASDVSENPTTSFGKESLYLLRRLEAMETFLKEIAADYLDLESYVASRASTMTDEERDNIDAETTIHIRDCQRDLSALQALINEHDDADQHRKPSASRTAHEQGIVLYLLERLKFVTKIVEQQRSSRYKKSLSAKEKFSAILTSEPSGNLSMSRSGNVDFALPTPNVEEDFALELDPEEEEVLRQENQLLEAEFESELEEVRQMETKMAEISGLLSLFTEKVIEQQDDIENIHSAAIDSKSNVSEAGNQLQQAISHGDSFVKFMVIFLFGAGTLLLMLDYFA